ncbi:MAG: recombinase family protein [bacterium]
MVKRSVATLMRGFPLRTSTGAPNTPSLESQEKVCKANITSQESSGWEYVSTTEDLGSGGSTDRLGLSERLKHIKQDKVDVVVTIKTDWH